MLGMCFLCCAVCVWFSVHVPGLGIYADSDGSDEDDDDAAASEDDEVAGEGGDARSDAELKVLVLGVRI